MILRSRWWADDAYGDPVLGKHRDGHGHRPGGNPQRLLRQCRLSPNPTGAKGYGGTACRLAAEQPQPRAVSAPGPDRAPVKGTRRPSSSLAPDTLTANPYPHFS